MAISSIDLSALNGTNGFVLEGINAGDSAGISVSNAGDINGDGISDLIIGADQAGSSTAGDSYVVFGSASGFSSTFDLSTLNGTNGFTIEGLDANDRTGVSVSSAGDVNDDGFDDLIVGAPGGDPNSNTQAGESYVIFGSNSGFSSTIDPSSLDGSDGFVINGVSAADQSGFSVSDAGDVNGDGIDDVIIGAFVADPNGNSGAGESYVVFGSDTGFSASLDLSSLNGTNGFVIEGIDADDESGVSVSSAGDINNDGVGDLIIGAYLADPGGESEAGESYVVFGSSAGFSSSLDLSTLNGTNGFVLEGIGAGDRTGRSVSTAGDINGDGIEDLIIGAGLDPSNPGLDAGEIYVVYGSNSAFSSSLDLSTLDGTNGFTIRGASAGDNVGRAVSHAGDVNGDGHDDIIVGAHLADPNSSNSAGQSYVVYGSPAGFSAVLELSDINGSNGFVINGEAADDRSGISVSAAGDINDDGVDDIIIGADSADPNGNSGAGAAYVVYGQQMTTIHGTTGNDTLTGTSADEYIYGGLGSDTLDGAGGDDTLSGGDGNDTLTGGTGADVLYGGAGLDWALYTSSSTGVTVNLETNVHSGGDAQGDSLFGIELVGGSAFADTLTGDANNNSLVGGAGNDTLTGGGGADALYGGTGLDWALYSSSSTGVTVNLETGVHSGGDAQGDVLVGIELLGGSANADVLTGDSANNTLIGGDGNDTLTGGGGADSLYGGAGIDWALYTSSSTGVTVNLETNVHSGGDAQGDNLVDIELVAGSANADTLIGNSSNNTLSGAAGDDSLTGGSGADALYGGAGDDTFNFASNLGNDIVGDFVAGAGSDDVISLQGLSVSDLSDVLAITSQSGSDAVITFDASNSITLQNVTVANLHADDFQFI